MGTKTIIQTKSITVWTVLGFLLGMSWRFFLGQPMNGKRIDNSTFLKGATRGKPGRVLTKWQKKPHIHRSIIRQSVFWPICFVFGLFIVDRTVALFVLAFISFPTGWLLFRKGRLVFFDPYTSTDATTGNRTQLWQLKNRYRKLLHKQPIPGYIARKDRFDPQLRVEMQDAVAADLNENEFKGITTIFSNSISRYRRQTTRKDR